MIRFMCSPGACVDIVSKSGKLLFAGLALGLSVSPVLAGEAEWETSARAVGISELRAGVMLHGVETTAAVLPNINSIDPNKWQNVNFEVLFRPPDVEFVRWLGSPRISLSTTLNFAGRDSYASLASVWHIPILDTPFFFEPNIGVTVHNGYLHNPPPGRRQLGCPALLNLGYNIGVNVSDRITGVLTVEHSSSVWMCGPDNDGVNRVGIRVGYKLD